MQAIKKFSGSTLSGKVSSGKISLGKVALERLEARTLYNAALPALPAIVAPASNPTLPSTFDVFTPQAPLTTTQAGAPSIGQFTQSANPGDTLAVSITNPGSQTQFFTYGQTTASNGALEPDTIDQLGGGVASVNLNSANTSNSMYLLWAANSSGFSAPVEINKANAWWVGPSQATAGQTVSVYGQNLTFSPTDGESWIYITQAGSSTGQWASVTSANPYQVSFVVPAGLSAGNYQVWVHNGHGGEYGWSSPVTLSVVAPAVTSNSVFNVLNYGAVGDGVTDSTAAFQAALHAAQQVPGSTVYIPTGNYIISQVMVPANVTITGDGEGKTNILESQTSNASALYTMMYLNPGVTMQNLTLVNNGTQLTDLVYGRSMTNLHFNNVNFNGGLQWDFDIHNDQYVFFSNCTLIGSSNFLGTAGQVFFNNDQFYATNDAGEMLYSWGGTGISITNCTVQDLNNSNPNSGAGWGQGRFFVGNNNWGTENDVYMADNTTIDMGVRSTFSNQNVGEQFLWETEPFIDTGTYVSSTATTLTYTGLPSTIVGAGYYAVVVAGDGVGEVDPIAGYNTTTGVVTLAQPWAATPDSTSVVRIGHIVDNVAVFDNTIQGKGVTSTASSGVQFWGGAINCVVDSNNISNVTKGIVIAGEPGYAGVLPDYFNLVQNNHITNTYMGLWIVNNGLAGQIGSAGDVFRFNTINTTADAGALIWDQQDISSVFFLILEGNSITNTPVAIAVPNYNGDTAYLTLSNNSFSLGNAAAAGSGGLQIAEAVVITEAGDTYSGFSTSNSGNVTPTTLAPETSLANLAGLLPTALNGSQDTGSGASSSTTSSGTSGSSTTASSSGTTSPSNTSNTSGTTSQPATPVVTNPTLPSSTSVTTTDPASPTQVVHASHRRFAAVELTQTTETQSEKTPDNDEVLLAM